MCLLGADHKKSLHMKMVQVHMSNINTKLMLPKKNWGKVIKFGDFWYKNLTTFFDHIYTFCSAPNKVL